MEQVFGLCCGRYPTTKRVALCLALTIGSLLFIADYCRAQKSDQPAEYETPGILDAYEILPSELLEGKNFWMDRRVVSYGLNNHYTINSHFGKFEANGEDMLRMRQQEIRAIDGLREVKKTSAFGEAFKKAATSPLKGAQALITDPVATVKGIPKGIGKFFGRIGEMTKGGRGDLEDSYTKELIGFSRVKRQYAYKFGVDVYSSNEVLQKELNSVSWAGFAGGMTVNVAMMGIKSASNAAYLAVKGTQLTYGMNKILLGTSPEDLQKLNRKIMEKMGVRESVIKDFQDNPAYSPRHTTILVHALAEMQGVKNREQFIRQALHAEYEDEAFLYQRMAEMLHGYHTEVKPIKEIIPVRKFVVGYTSDQTVVATFPIDLLYWIELSDLGSAALAKLDLTGRPIKKTEIWVTGSLTPRTMKEFNARGLIIKERAGEVLLPPLQEVPQEE
ncbi:MAG: hypothetical protein K8F52_13050 [Candidatus Scalindua rubra]|uniref:Uncharacterized protein n=1 Tax=Candidatus Scalindua brodae TaxID=237368 RepID=A0A0B0EH68_9BACT|nr:MAG: hypothetical protein SCABRO_03843 [Candidatus Scalindua brodae]MBZ0109588.1 hypothetical protein [Candidatus Scalindua rubra]TWU33158.1 hypothetical protein S225a_16100 [Candidatus Brocadiaceae bacterium S225]